MKKRFFFNVFCVLFLVSLVSCDLLNSSLKGYIDEYTNNAAIMRHEFISDSLLTDASGNTCIDQNGTVSLYIRNPKNYDLDFTYAFNIQSVQNWYDNNYSFAPIEFIKIDSDLYTLKFPEEMLLIMDENTMNGWDYATGTYDYENTTRDLSGTISLFEHETQRPFGTYDISLHADSAPTPIARIMVQQTMEVYDHIDEQNTYVVCFSFPESNTNRDFDTIRINNDVFKVNYSDDVISGFTDVGENAGVLNRECSVDLYPVLEDSDLLFSDFDNTGRTCLYYFSADYRSDAVKTYNITITDNAGLTASASITSSAEMLAPVTFQILEYPDIDFSEDPITGNDTTGKVTLRISAAETTAGNAVSGTPKITYILHSREDEDGTTYTANGRYVDIPLETLNFYNIEAYATCPKYISSEWNVTNLLLVKHTPNIYVSNSGNDETGLGTVTKPFRTIQQCLSFIEEAGEIWIDAGDDGYFINLLSNITPTESDYQDGADYLVSNGNFSGKLTIQGVDASGNAAKRTIDAQGKGGLLSWTAISSKINNLTLKNLKFTNGYANTSSSSAGLYFYTFGRNGPSNDKFRATLTNCDITGMTGTGGYGLYFYGGNGSLQDENTSTVTMTDCTISNNEKQGIFQTYTAQSRATYEKLILDGNTKIQNNAEGGIFSELGLYLKSKNVTISGNSGYGVSASAFSYIEIEGATITNNKDSSGLSKNIWLGESTNNSGVVTRAFINVTGDLTGSRIGVWTETGPESVLDDPIEFATYDEGNKPGTGVFTSDTGLEVNLGETSATLVYVLTPTISGSLDIPDQFFDDIRVTATGIQDTENAKMIVTLQFIDSENTVLDDVTINSVTIVDGSAEMPNTAGSVRLWDFTDGQLVVYCTAKPISNGQIQLVPLMVSYSSSNKMFFKVVFTYKGKTYSALVMN